MRVLLVEDDELLGDGIRVGLKQYQYTVDWVKNGVAALQALQTEHFDMVVLDLGLPRLSGDEVLKSMRTKNINTPVIILTARDTIDDRVKGLDIGADDYIVKPFDLDELCARIRAVQRRTASRAEPTITYENIVLDPAARTVSKDGQSVELSRREFVLLQMLLENIGRVLSREQITQSLYGWGDDIDSNALEVHIHNLRKKFGNDFISTIRGVGYLLEKSKKE
ncbi:MAG: response regulator [Gammaproteobacteria bacterium]|nr:response regulator [Gammaproteobacteria bacterium]